MKDPSIFTFAPRHFAHIERLQIREITDDLLNRGIIQKSISPYCSRVVPVRKRNGQIRLCVDLRPLNNRVEKQKYPFPVIEDCLSRLANKTVFTLFDLKDGFHQIKVHPNSMKYFCSQLRMDSSNTKDCLLDIVSPLQNFKNVLYTF